MRGSLFVGLVLVQAACSRAPDAGESERIYDAHRSTLAEVDARLQALAAEVLAIRCAGSVTATPCPRQGTAEERRLAAKAGFELLARPNLIGIEAAWHGPGEKAWQPLLDVGLTPGGLYPEGRVEPAQGLTIDDRQVGRGRYQTSWSQGNGPTYGDGDARPGIEVEWTFAVGGSTVRAYVLILADHHPSDEWRAALAAASDLIR